MTPDVTVVVPTFRRPAGLALALESVAAQTGCPPFELLVVDNDPGAGAKPVVEAFTARLPPHITLTYLHEPKAGVANARNAAADKVRTRYIAFLDDDQTADPDWLQSMLSCAARYPAAVTFGPVRAALPESAREHTAYLSAFFSRPELGQTGYAETSYGCGNSFIDMTLIPPERPVFDARMNETGGEDDLLFGRVRKSGGRFAWCAEAVVLEHVPPSRAQLGYTLRRALGYGQGPITMARQENPVNWFKVAFWMLVGVYKLITHGLLYAAGWITRRPNRAWHLDRAVRGLGKLVWWVRFRFYGAAQL